MCSLAFAPAVVFADPLPAVQSLHRDWTFNYLPASTPDLAVTAPGFDDTRWPAIALPHTWNVFETTGEVHPFIRAASERIDPYWWKGWGIYRKRFVVAADLRDRLVFVEFDGVQKYARVFLNGHELGENKGGYFAFSRDLTPHLRLAAENVLVVLVSNRRDDPFGGIPPMTAGNFNVYGGIYRGVRLVVKDRLHLPFQGSPEHEGGTFVTTPEVNAERGVVRVQTWLRNAYATPRAARVVTRLLDPAGALLQTLTRDVTIAPGATERLDQTSASVAHPQLWSPDSPALYSVETLVESDGRVVDRTTSPLGFRWFRWDKNEKRLYLNGRHVPINGTNRHQEYPWLGDAMPPWMHTRDHEDMRRNLGHNFMRTAHYPQDDFIYDLNDRLGIITVCEVPNIKAIKFGRAIQEANARAMVRRHRNHPSIVFWSVGNETSQAADSRWVHEEDPTRLIHQRKAEQFGDFVTHDHTDLDMENLLRCTVRGWHDADVPGLARLHPDNGQTTGTEEWQHLQARVPGSSVRGVVGAESVAWLYADHGCDRVYKNAPLQHLNPKGWVDPYRIPKPMYYLWQANGLEAPMVRLHGYAWQHKFAGQPLEFRVDSNCDEVELFANERSLGVRRPTHENMHTVTFEQVVVEPGRLRAEARRGGRTVATHEVPMPGPPARLIVTAAHGRLVADRAGIAEIRATIVDAAGVPVPGAQPPLTWAVAGPGRLVGPARYDSDYEKDGALDGVWYFDTPICNLVRTTTEPGTIRVRVSAPGLADGSVEIPVAPDGRAAPAGIVELPLREAGRHPVGRIAGFVDSVAFVADIAPMRDSPRFGERSMAEYRATLDRLIRERNPALKPALPAYDRLLERLAGQLAASSGNLIEDDFNYLTSLYNTGAHLGRVLDLLGMHPGYLAAWRAHLANQLLVRGVPADVAEMTTFFRVMPTRGQFAELKLASDRPSAEYDRVTYVHFVRAADLRGALVLLYPAFAAAPAEEQSRLEAEVRRINPWLAAPEATVRLWLPETGAWRVTTPTKKDL
jgi:hypothetical protein